MTKDRALEVLAVYASVNGSGRCTQDEFEEAKKMAIEALESQDRQAIIAGSYLLEGEDNVPDTNVGDIISRQAAIDTVKGEFFGALTPEERACAIRDIPSAQPEKCEDAVSREEATWVVFCHRDHVEDQVNAIDELPSVRASAQEVVRCKDCIYKEECGREVLVNEYDNDKAVDITGFLFYCSYGERAEA